MTNLYIKSINLNKYLLLVLLFSSNVKAQNSKRTVYNRNVLNGIKLMDSLQAAISMLHSDRSTTERSGIGLILKGFQGWPL